MQQLTKIRYSNYKVLYQIETLQQSAVRNLDSILNVFEIRTAVHVCII